MLLMPATLTAFYLHVFSFSTLLPQLLPGILNLEAAKFSETGPFLNVAFYSLMCHFEQQVSAVSGSRHPSVRLQRHPISGMKGESTL